MSNTTTRLINALKTITSESKDIKFDKTVQGKIVAIVNEEQYRVSINNAIVLAYVTDGSTYKEGDNVYILIPEGDPSNIKTITGKVPLTSSAIVVTDPMEGISKVGMPFEDLYGLTGRRVSIIPDQSGVRKDVNIVNYDYPSRYEEIVETSKKYSHMMLNADFYNFFSDAASISKGSFGMHLTFSCLYENNYTTLEVELDSADMLGDIYSLAAPVTMYKFFSIPYGYVVTGLEQVSIYQGGNFNGNINGATDWIIGGNIHLSFIDGENIRNNEIKFSLTTEDNGTYFSDEVDTLWLYGSTDKVVSGETYFWFQQDDSVNSMSDSGYNQYGGIGWRLLDATTENKYAISNYDGFIQSNYKAVIVINTGQFYVSNIITLNQSGINIPQLKYHIEEDIIKFDLDFNKNEYEIYWRKENAMHNPIYGWAGEEDSYDAIESRAWYYVTVLKYGTGEIVYNAAKTIVSSAENGTIINNFSGALLHHYDANGDLSQDAQDSIYSLTAEMGDSVGGRWDLPADVVFPYQSDDSLLVIQSVSANTIYYKLAPKYDANKMNNTLVYIIGDERYSQYITVLKDGDNGTNGTRYSAKIVRTPRSSKYLYHNGYNWVNNEYEVQVLVYKDGVSVEDFKVKQWLIPKTRAIINSVLKLQNDALTCKIRFETDAEAIGLPWNKATVIGEVESSNDSLIYQWTVDGQIYSNTSTCKFDIEKDFEGQLQCVILDSHGDRVGEFNQNINAEAVDNSHTSLTNSAVGYYTKRINTDENNHILSIGVEGTCDDIVNYYQNVVEAEIEVDGYSIFAYHAVPVCYGVNQVEVEEINSNVIYKSDGMNPQFTPFAIVSNITNPEITTLGQASIVGGEYTPASKFLYDEGMPAIRVTDVDSDSFCIIPIVTILNNYGLSYLNSWDGTSIEINEDGGYILAPQIGAGVKEEDNSFSGVLMGQLEGVSSNAGLVGLYGFDHGSASYGFLQDGTAFIGKSGLGQIKFDGNESTIMSANYEVNKKGMKLDLLNGTIDASGFNIDKDGNASFNGNVVAVSGQFGPLVLEDGKIVYRGTDPIEGLSTDLTIKYLLSVEQITPTASSNWQDNYPENFEGYNYLYIGTFENNELKGYVEQDLTEIDPGVTGVTIQYSCNTIPPYIYEVVETKPSKYNLINSVNPVYYIKYSNEWVLAKNYELYIDENYNNLTINDIATTENNPITDFSSFIWSDNYSEPTLSNPYLWQKTTFNKQDASENIIKYLLIKKYQTTNDVFNELTHNGEDQGFFFGADGKLYVNAEMIKAGYIDADRIEAGTITANKVNLKGLEIKNNNNVTTFTIDNDGNVTTNGVIKATSLSIGGGNNIINQQGGLNLPSNSTIPGYTEEENVLDATQIIYYRSNDNSSLPTAPEDNEDNPEWLEEQDSTISKYGAWSKKIAEPTGNYTYLYSCVQTKMLDGTVSNSQVRQDDGSGGGKAREQYIYCITNNQNLVNKTATMPSETSIPASLRWRASGGTISQVDNNDPPITGISKAARITNTGSSATRIGICQDSLYHFTTEETYSMSCWVRASQDNTQFYLQPIWGSSSQTTGTSYNKLGTIKGYYYVGTSWTRISWNGAVLTGDQKSFYSAGYVYANNVPSNGWIEVCCIKVEKGDTITDWMYAPDEVPTDIWKTYTGEPNPIDPQYFWTIKPPTYRRDYPYTLTAIQTQSVAQQNYGGICCNCSTPLIDDTTTVIDGGHITTGVIQCNSNETNFWDLGNGLLSIGESNHTWLEHDDLPVPPATVNGVGFQYISNTKQWEFSGTATADITVNLYHLDRNLLSVPEHHCFSFETSEGLLDASNSIQVWFNNTNITNNQYDIITGTLDHIKLFIESGTSIPQGSYIKVNYHTGVINGNVIKAGTIDASLVNVTNIDADNINTGHVTANYLDLKGLSIRINPQDASTETLRINQDGSLYCLGAIENNYDTSNYAEIGYSIELNTAINPAFNYYFTLTDNNYVVTGFIKCSDSPETVRAHWRRPEMKLYQLITNTQSKIILNDGKIGWKTWIENNFIPTMDGDEGTIDYIIRGLDVIFDNNIKAWDIQGRLISGAAYDLSLYENNFTYTGKNYYFQIETENIDNDSLKIGYYLNEYDSSTFIEFNLNNNELITVATTNTQYISKIVLRLKANATWNQTQQCLVKIVSNIIGYEDMMSLYSTQDASISSNNFQQSQIDLYGFSEEDKKIVPIGMFSSGSPSYPQLNIVGYKDINLWTRYEGNIKFNNVPLQDFVIDESINPSGWSYRWWYSGKMECWGRWTNTRNCSTVSGALYTCSSEITPGNYPNGGFDAIPTTNVNLESPSGVMTAVTTQGTATTSPKFKPMLTYSNNSVSLYVSVYAIGYKARV